MRGMSTAKPISTGGYFVGVFAGNIYGTTQYFRSYINRMTTWRFATITMRLAAVNLALPTNADDPENHFRRHFECFDIDCGSGNRDDRRFVQFDDASNGDKRTESSSSQAQSGERTQYAQRTERACVRQSGRQLKPGDAPG